MKKKQITYLAPVSTELDLEMESEFLGSSKPGSGVIPPLEEGDVPDDLWN